MKKNKVVLTIITIILFVLPACNKFSENFELKEGDLLFSVGKGESQLLKAIQNATSKKQDIPFSHVGIVMIENDSIFVLEAEPSKGVIKTPVEKFFDETLHVKGKPVIAVGRVKPQFEYTISGAVKNTQNHLGKKYDFAYDETNNDFYCSELVRFAFIDSLGNPVFAPLAMSFKNKETAQPEPYWIEHFQKLGKEIPEGKPGTNPADMAKSPVINIVHTYY